MKRHIHFSIQVPGNHLLWKNLPAFAKAVEVTGDESSCPQINDIVAECRSALLSGAWEGRRLRRLDQQREASRRYRERKRIAAELVGPANRTGGRQGK